MAKTRPYREALLEALANPVEAAHYLNAAIEDSPEMFLKAVRNVAQAHQVAKIAKQSGVTRENLYRAFSAKGNPTLDTLLSVLSAMGLKIGIDPKAYKASEPARCRGGNRIDEANLADVNGNAIKTIEYSSGSLIVQTTTIVPEEETSEPAFLPGFMLQQQSLRDYRGFNGD